MADSNLMVYSFKLSEDFVESYKSKKAPFGYADAAGNSVGEITFLRTYSRLKDDGTKETWIDVCERVINGMYSLQKEHCKKNRLPWNDIKAQSSAKEAFDRLFNLKWTPPGRGLWVMGTPIVMVQKNSAALQNCAFVSTSEMTKNNPAKPFGFLMEASMLGVGVGFDDKGADKDFMIYEPNRPTIVENIDDSREGWVNSVMQLINSYLKPDQNPIVFDYSQIRPSGTPIKTFGGTAAGADPLIKLHGHIRKMFDGRAGQKLTRVDIADIGNTIGVCVVSGNVRRSAELLIGRLDDDNFLNLKNAERFPERNSYDSAAPGWGWMSNNSVEVGVGSDLSGIVEGIARNGEPGVIWMDVSRKYGRLADPPNNKDWRVAGYNPCLVPETWVMTDQGPKQIRDLIGRPFNALVNGKPFETISSGFWMTSASADVYDIITDSGWSARVTDNHQIMTGRGWIAAKDLVNGDEIHLHSHGDVSWAGPGVYEEGYLLGSLWGDGTLNSQIAVLSVWGGDVSLMPAIEKYAKNVLNLRSDWKGFTKVLDRDEWRLRSADLATLAKSWGMQNGNKKIEDAIERGSSDFYRGFLQAAFDSDGHIEGNKEKGVSIRLSQSDYEQLQKIQRMLGRLGIISKIRKMHDEQTREMPGGIYDCKPSWRLIISGQNAKLFMDRIGFGHESKALKWEKLSYGINFYNKPALAKFIELEYAGTSAVYDVTVADVHAFDANGIYVHNCAEQSLESYECCTLVETYLNRHDSLDDFKRTLKFAYLYAKTVTLLPTHWEETNAIMQRNRRIGTSVSGVANFADRVGMPVLRDWLDQGYQTVQRYDNIYSEWLGIRESIKTTTVKPSGTVSILAGESPGVHWTPGGEYFMRAIRFSNDDPMLPLFKMANYKVEQASESPNTTSVVFFPIKSNALRSEKDVTIFEKMSLAAAAQRYWSDNSVSVTISFDSEEEKQHVGTVLHMYDGQLKTVSFLPQGNFTYPQMPYTQIDEKEYIESSMNLLPIDLSGVYAGLAADAIGENYCTTDSCEIKFIKDNQKDNTSA